MNIEKEIEDIKQRLFEASQDGRNPIAIQGKFENVFQLINEINDKIGLIQSRINKIEKKLENKRKSEDVLS